MNRTSIYNKISLLLILGLCYACGVEVGNPRKPTDGSGNDTGNTSIIALDLEATGEIISGQIDEAVLALTEIDNTNSASSNTGTHLTTPFSLTNIDFSSEFKCEESDDGAKVTKKVSGSSTFFRGGKILGKKIVASDTNSKTATWSNDSGTVKCNDKKTRAVIDFRTSTELKMALTLGRSRNMAVTRRANGNLLRETHVLAHGTRNFSWVREDSSDTETKSVRATIYKKLTRSQTITTAISGTQELRSVIEVSEDSPFDVLSIYNTDEGTLKTKTIESGTQTATQTDGSFVRSTYTDVVINSESGCRPESGSIYGEVFDATDLDKAAVTFTVLFSERDAVITFDNGETKFYSATLCGLDQD